MKRLILMACIAGILAPMGLYPQKVYKDGDKVILDMTVEAGMPAGAVTSESKTSLYNAISPNNNGLTVINEANNDQNHPLNATVYQKLEISKNDPGTQTWADAFKYCKNNEGADAEWRLPTQRELMMMYIFKDALNALLEKDFGWAEYWSSTEDSASISWSVVLGDGLAGFVSKSNSFSVRVRCVREITP